MNADGIYNSADFSKGDISVIRSEYEFPEEAGTFVIEGVTVCRYWGKRGNLILLIKTEEGKKLKFSFWNNVKYCFEPIPKRKLDVEKDSVRYLSDGTKIRLTYEKSISSNVTRVREIERLSTCSK